MDVYFINDTSDSINWGSQATSKSMRYLINQNEGDIIKTEYKKNLKKIQADKYRHQTVEYLPSLISSIAKYTVNKEVKNIYKSTSSIRDTLPFTYSEFDKYAKETLREDLLTEYTNPIRKSDLLIINGEGLMKYSISRITRANLFLAYLAIEYLDTPCVLSNHTLDIKDKKLRKMIEQIYPKLDGVIFREPVSARKYGYLCNNHAVAADAVFAHPIKTNGADLNTLQEKDQLNIRPYESPSIDFEQEYVCVAGTSIFGKQSQYNLEDYLELCGKLKQICEQIVLIESASPDAGLLSCVANELSLPIIGLNTPVDPSMSILANSSVYIGGRYHPTIFSAKGGTPIIPLSAYTHKLDGLFELLNLDLTIYDAFDFSESIEEIADLTEKYIQNPEKFSHLEKRSEELGEQAHLNVGPLQE